MSQTQTFAKVESLGMLGSGWKRCEAYEGGLSLLHSPSSFYPCLTWLNINILVFGTIKFTSWSELSWKWKPLFKGWFHNLESHRSTVFFCEMCNATYLIKRESHEAARLAVSHQHLISPVFTSYNSDETSSFKFFCLLLGNVTLVIKVDDVTTQYMIEFFLLPPKSVNVSFCFCVVSLFSRQTAL